MQLKQLYTLHQAHMTAWNIYGHVFCVYVILVITSIVLFFSKTVPKQPTGKWQARTTAPPPTTTKTKGSQQFDENAIVLTCISHCLLLFANCLQENSSDELYFHYNSNDGLYTKYICETNKARMYSRCLSVFYRFGKSFCFRLLLLI